MHGSDLAMGSLFGVWSGCRCTVGNKVRDASVVVVVVRHPGLRTTAAGI